MTFQKILFIFIKGQFPFAGGVVNNRGYYHGIREDGREETQLQRLAQHMQKTYVWYLSSKARSRGSGRLDFWDAKILLSKFHEINNKAAQSRVKKILVPI